MTGVAYEPGTVAVATVRGVKDVRVMAGEGTAEPKLRWFTTDNRVYAAGDPEDDGWYFDFQVTDVRQLVVLDPDNDLSIGPLRAALKRWVEWSSLTAEKAHIGNLLTLIERQVTPPKPAEPTGLGAVVRGRDGRVFVRVCSRHPGDDGYDWRADGAFGSDSSNRAWRDIDAVEVLHEGHQSGWYDRGGAIQRGATS